jgi:SAM-dependent methyltransferase
MTAERRRASATGAHALQALARTPKLNGWIVSKLEAGVRGEVLEIGSGVGTISRLIRHRADHLVLTDAEPHYLDALRGLFPGDGGVEVAAYDLGAPPPPAVEARRYDTIVAINVIEHIADDHALIARLAHLLRPGGSLLVYVPAGPIAYGPLDAALGHHRRYTRATLTALLSSAALHPGRPRYINFLGLCGWMVYGHVLRRELLPPRAVALFERLVPLVRLEDKLTLPVGLGLYTRATKPTTKSATKPAGDA